MTQRDGRVLCCKEATYVQRNRNRLLTQNCGVETIATKRDIVGQPLRRPRLSSEEKDQELSIDDWPVPLGLSMATSLKESFGGQRGCRYTPEVPSRSERGDGHLQFFMYASEADAGNSG